MGPFEKTFSFLFDLMFPADCPLCGLGPSSKSSQSFPLCAKCAQGLFPITGPFCSVCGTPVIVGIKTCSPCKSREISPLFYSQKSLFLYREPVKELIFQYKAKACKDIAVWFARQVFARHINGNPGFPIIPAPASPASLKERGWDQVLEICKHLHNLYSSEILPILGRKASISQKKLGSKERQENLKDKIFIKPAYLKKIKHFPEDVFLLDDVFTTGATLNECSAVLQRAGVRRIHGITLAID